MPVEVKKDEYLFKTFADAMPQMAFIANEKGEIIYYNERWYNYIGKINNTEGWGWKDQPIHHPDDIQKTLETWKHSVATHEPYEIEYRLRRHDGKYRWHLGRANPIFDDEGNIQLWLGTNTDIHDQKQTEEALKISEENYRNIFNSMDQGYCLMEMIFDDDNNPIDYRFLEINPTFSQQTGLKDAKGKTAKELVPDLEDKWIQIYGKIALTGESHYFVEGSAAMNRWFDVHAFKVGDEGSNKVALLFTDISSKKEAEEEKENAQKMLRFALSAGSIDVWVWDIIHDKVISSEVLANVFSLNPKKISSEGLPLNDFLQAIHPDDRAYVQDQINESVKNGSLLEIEYRVLNKDNEIKWVITRGKPEFNSVGKAVRFPGVLMDITERKKAELSLLRREQDFRTLADNISQLAWMTDDKGYIFWYNKRWFDYTGTSLSEMEGWQWQNVHHPDHVARVVKKFSNAINEGEVWEDIFPLLGKDGKYRWFLSRAIPIKDENGKIENWFGTNTDITQLRETEKQLNFQNSLFEAQQEVSPLGILVISPEGKIITYNKRFVDLWSMEDIIDEIETDDEAIDFVEDQIVNYEAFRSDIKSCYENRTKNHQKLYFKNGQILDRYGSPVIGENGHNFGYVWFFMDNTEQEKLAKQKDEFLGIASHELKTPLTIVKAYMQLLEQQISEPQLQSYISKSADYVNKLDALITDLFDVSKILAGKLQFQFMDIKFDDLVNNTIESASQIYNTHVLVKEGSTSDTIISGDRTRLEQVLINLISNGIKYSPDGEKIHIKCEVEGDNIIVAVTDFGIGIPKHAQQKLFDRFYRVDDASDRFSGLGIGLFIVSEIISRHYGKVWLESEEGKGSTFYFSLPVVK